jgi:hypothetical protein
MAVSVEMHNTGCVPAVRSEIVALIEHVLADRPGDWRVLIVGSQANDRSEMKIMDLMRLSDRTRLRELPANMSHVR